MINNNNLKNIYKNGGIENFKFLYKKYLKQYII
jgi:hypothetical protein